ncbi:hypothetical protein Hypma_014323 [Hypsizygus marmoreus]|uniref:Uncharacterized protein n=1 Tax=Hypsizygus marmoreus TaxID=39966 RepID=A0A369JB04_HYPMA|nr:hypothetical protein Hypma_014323 [Hypsizygus marmoreus]
MSSLEPSVSSICVTDKEDVEAVIRGYREGRISASSSFDTAELSSLVENGNVIIYRDRPPRDSLHSTNYWNRDSRRMLFRGCYSTRANDSTMVRIQYKLPGDGLQQLFLVVYHDDLLEHTCIPAKAVYPPAEARNPNMKSDEHCFSYWQSGRSLMLVIYEFPDTLLTSIQGFRRASLARPSVPNEVADFMQGVNRERRKLRIQRTEKAQWDLIHSDANNVNLADTWDLILLQ